METNNESYVLEYWTNAGKFYKEFTLMIYGLAFTTKTCFALDLIASEHKVKIVVASELVFWIALILDSIYNTK